MLYHAVSLKLLHLRTVSISTSCAGTQINHPPLNPSHPERIHEMAHWVVDWRPTVPPCQLLHACMKVPMGISITCARVLRMNKMSLINELTWSYLQQLSSRLEKFYLHLNNLTTFPVALLDFAHLRILNLSHNKISGSIPPEISKLRSLEVLNLAYNRITSLPPSISQLDQLTDLYLGTSERESKRERKRKWVMLTFSTFQHMFLVSCDLAFHCFVLFCSRRGKPNSPVAASRGERAGSQ